MGCCPEAPCSFLVYTKTPKLWHGTPFKAHVCTIMLHDAFRLGVVGSGFVLGFMVFFCWLSQAAAQLSVWGYLETPMQCIVGCFGQNYIGVSGSKVRYE